MKLLGSGTYANVYKIISNHKEYAIKILKCYSELIYKEIDFLTKLKNTEYVINFHDIIFDEYTCTYSKPGLMLEYVSNTLDSMKNSLTFQEKKHIFHKLLIGLNYIHANNIIHRDIKLNNILLDSKTLTPKFCDFGISFYSKSKLKNICITKFCPPEIYRRKIYSFPIDIWMLAISMIEFLFSIKINNNFEKKFLEVHVSSDDLKYLNWNTSTRASARVSANTNINYKNKLYNEIIMNNFDNKEEYLKCYELLQLMLAINPENRITALDAANHYFFNEKIQKSISCSRDVYQLKYTHTKLVDLMNKIKITNLEIRKYAIQIMDRIIYSGKVNVNLNYDYFAYTILRLVFYSIFEEMDTNVCLSAFNEKINDIHIKQEYYIVKNILGYKLFI